jgi:predicted thioesterase
MTPQSGSERRQRFVVEGRLLTDVGGSIGVPVLSTPSMIGMMEQNAARLAIEQLPDGYATVGFEVSVRHFAAAREGTECEAYAVLREVVEDRKLRFEVEVVALGDGEPRVIGKGTHERRVIDVAAHAQSAGH